MSVEPTTLKEGKKSIKMRGKRFRSMNVVGPAVTRDGAEKWEEERLEQYRKSHGGKNPRYNETDK